MSTTLLSAVATTDKGLSLFLIPNTVIKTNFNQLELTLGLRLGLKIFKPNMTFYMGQNPF